jgi:hypothetical protein
VYVNTQWEKAKIRSQQQLSLELQQAKNVIEAMRQEQNAWREQQLEMFRGEYG